MIGALIAGMMIACGLCLTLLAAIGGITGNASLGTARGLNLRRLAPPSTAARATPPVAPWARPG